MKRVLLVVLLLGLVAAGSALERSDFGINIKNGPMHTIGPEGKTITTLLMLDSRISNYVFGVEIKLVDLPEGLTLIGEDTQMVEDVTAMMNRWELRSDEEKPYDLSNSFEIVSWDDSVALEVDAVPETSDERIVTIRGRTDMASLCEEHQYKGFWGQRENCQVKILVNNREYWAERSGVFVVEYELVEGNNRIGIVAQDPGGNTAEKTLYVKYVPSIGAVVERNMIPVVVFIVLVVAGIIGLVVYWKSKKAAREEVITETLGELREKQNRLFGDFVNRCGMRGGYDEQSGTMLVDVFKQIVRKDGYYGQGFPDKRLAIKQREEIFRNEKVKAGVRDILLQKYLQVLEKKGNQAP